MNVEIRNSKMKIGYLYMETIYAFILLFFQYFSRTAPLANFAYFIITSPLFTMDPNTSACSSEKSTCKTMP